MRRASVVLVAGLLAVLAASVPTTLARFTGAKDATASFATASILPPTALAAASAGTVITLTWTPTTSAGVQGYDVLRSSSSGSGYSLASSLTPRTATTTTDSPGNGTWYYVLRSSLERWRSVPSNEASATVSSGITGFKPCTTNVADSGGDNNGYETAGASACVTDGVYATDAGSGTNATVSCTDAGKDRHRFGGFALGLPGTVASVTGIEVWLVAGMNNNGGTSMLCVQLSPNGGTTWTVAKQVTPTGAALATYTLGGSTDTWGRTWTAGELASGALMVRIIDVTSQPSKDFRLDGLSVQVRFTP